jgi:hypothetical protein
VRAVQKPLPGDLVIRPREDRSGPQALIVYVLTRWPDAEQVVGGPYMSYSYALKKAHERREDARDYVWRDLARAGESERLEDVSDGHS